MSNSLATNAVVPKAIDTQYYLRASKNGFPINGQVPRTYQIYTGTGNETITYDGSNEIRVFGGTLTGDLIISLGSLQSTRNWVGRTVTLNIIAPITRSVTVTTGGALISINGTALQQLSHVIPGDGNSKSITIYFHTPNSISLDYGAASVVTLAPKLPQMSTLLTTYPYGQITGASLPVFSIPDSGTYDVVVNSLNKQTEGYLDNVTTSITGPGVQNLFLVYYPASGRTETTDVTGYITKSGEYFGSFTVQFSPILTGVYEAPYVVGSSAAGGLSMYSLDSVDNTKIAITSNGFPVDLGANLRSIATSIRNNVVFFVSSTSNTTIRFYSFNTGFSTVFLNVASAGVAYWTVGATILDIAFDERENCLFVLPNLPTAILLRIPVLPVDEIANPGGFPRPGHFMSRTLTFPGTTALFSLAVCPITSAIYIASRPAATNNIIQAFSGFNSFVPLNAFVHPSVNTGRTAIAFTPKGKLCSLYESSNILEFVSDFVPGTWTGALVVSAFSVSLSQSCYGWVQG